MKITQVHYQRLVNLGNYENEHFGAWANVGEDETPAQAIAALQEWVHQQADTTQEVKATAEKLRAEVGNLEFRKKNLEREIQQAKEIWERAQAFLDKHGLQVPSRYREADGLPFEQR